MAYQKTGTPRFYINLLEWMSVNRIPGGAEGAEAYYPRIYDSEGNVSDSFKEIFRTYPRLAEAVEYFGVDLIEQTESSESSNYNLLDHGEGGNGFIAFLGHKFGDGNGVQYKLSGAYDLLGMVEPPDIAPPEPDEDWIWCYIASTYEESGLSNLETSQECLDAGGQVVPSYWLPEPEPGTGEVVQEIVLTNGWNMVSFNVTPQDSRFLTSDGTEGILSTLVQQDLMVKLIDQNGSTVEWVSFLGSWYNGVGLMRSGYGYHLRVHNLEGYDASLFLSGTPLMNNISMEQPFVRDLGLGWNIIGVPTDFSVDVAILFDTLMNGGYQDGNYIPPNTLIKLINENGKTVEYASFIDSWYMGFTTIDPGEAYYIRVNQPCQIKFYPQEYYDNFNVDSSNLEYDLEEGWQSRFLSYASNKHRITQGGRSGSRSLVPINLTELVNATHDGVEWSSPNYNGFSISSFNGIGVGNIEIDLAPVGEGVDSNNSCQSIAVGAFYDMPHSPELSLTMHREMEGVHKKKGLGGNEFVDYGYTKSRDWNDAPAWELYKGEGSTSETLKDLSKIGRRIWDLEFNYLSDTDLFTNISSLTNYETVSPSGETFSENDSVSENTLTQQSRFFSHVLHKTNGGQLPFIFQPDNENFNPDNFAICKFDMNTFEHKQVANGVYNIKVKIKEVW